MFTNIMTMLPKSKAAIESLWFSLLRLAKKDKATDRRPKIHDTEMIYKIARPSVRPMPLSHAISVCSLEGISPRIFASQGAIIGLVLLKLTI